jgi:hypothetical protein
MRCASVFIRTSVAGAKRRETLRLISLIVCALYMAVALLSSAYILIHANHIHDRAEPDGTCAVCAHIQAAENLLKIISAAIVSAAISFSGESAILFALISRRRGFKNFSLVALKVRLNN